MTRGSVPQLAQQLDLVVEAAGPVAERRAERLVLHVVPAGADAEDQSATRQQVDLGGLLGHERRLPLREHEHPGRQLDRGGVGGEEPEQDERLVERVVLVVGAGQRRIAVGVVGAEHVVVGGQPGEAERLGGLGKVAHGHRVVADLGRGEDGPEAHHEPASRATTGANSSTWRWGTVT